MSIEENQKPALLGRDSNSVKLDSGYFWLLMICLTQPKIPE
jgi:hypothetical protein